MLHLGTLELYNELGLQVLVPRHNQLSHLAKRWDPLRSHEEKVSQIDLALCTGLVDGKRSEVTSNVQISEAPLENDIARICWQANDIRSDLLLPSELGVELDL